MLDLFVLASSIVYSRGTRRVALIAPSTSKAEHLICGAVNTLSQ